MLSLTLLLAFYLAPSSANFLTLQDRYTADPAPFVHNGRVYIYTSHDLDGQVGWGMKDYSLMSSDDLHNWNDEGIVFDIRNQSWGVDAWAQQVIQGDDGNFYMYYPGMNTRPGDNRSGTGVAMSSSVTGPFNDALGHPLLPCGDDPTVFRDDDGTFYFCGNCNGGALCATLAPNMTALASTPVQVHLPQWFEAPWLSKLGGTYYLSYMCGGYPGHGQGDFNHMGFDICYGSCSGPQCSPLGPYVFRGSLMWSPPGNCGTEAGGSLADCAFQNTTSGDNNHQGLFEYPSGSGHLFLAYHSRTLAYSRGVPPTFQRNVALDRLYVRGGEGVYPLPPGLPWVVNDTAAGAGPGLLPVTSTPHWVRQVKYVDPYALVPATLSSAMSPGLNSEACSEGGLNLGFITPGSRLSLTGVDFGGGGGGASALTLRLATPLQGVSVGVWVDGVLATAPSLCAVPSTGDWQVFTNVTCTLTPGVAKGVVGNLTFTFLGPGTTGILNVRYWVAQGGVASGAIPPPASPTIALKAVATGKYLCAGGSAAGGVVTPSGVSPCPWQIQDLEDGTWALGVDVGNGGVMYACLSSGAGDVLAVVEPVTGAQCTRFWLYGTPPGTYAILSAGSGSFLTTDAQEEDSPLRGGGLDPRTTPFDGSRFVVEEL
jgi:arabinoxylan arabinofuranohydrolase